MFHPPVIRIILFQLLMLSTCGYAIWRGGAPERIIGCLLLAAVPISILASPSQLTRYVHVESGLFIVDLLLFVALAWVALRADRFWPLVLAAMQLDTIIVHVLKLVDADVIRVTYALMIAVWAYPMQIILAIGAARHRSRLRRFGEDRAWSGRFSS